MDPNKDAPKSATDTPLPAEQQNNNLPPSQPNAEQVFAPPPEPMVVRPTSMPPADNPPMPTSQPFQNQPGYTGIAAESAVPQSFNGSVPAANGQVYSGPGGILPGPVPSNNSKKKRLIIGGSAAAAVLLLSLGGVFGYYLPNKPENVWSTGLDRTGNTVDKLVIGATEEKRIAKVQNSEFTGSAEANIEGVSYKGSFNTKYDANQSDSTTSYDSGGEPEDFNMKLLTDLAEGQDYPDIYFQITGLATLGADQFYPGITEYDGKWISVSSAYLKSLIPAEVKNPDEQSKFTQQDAVQLARIVSATTNEYVFTADPDKAVMTRKNFIGTEKLEGDVTANHYTVGINKTNAKKYCKALIESFVAADAYKRLPGVNLETIDKDKQDAVKSCEEGIDQDIKDSDEFDMWIDKKRKLIHKIRLTDEDNKGTYIEVGQSYKKGDVIPLFIKGHSDKDKYDTKFTMEVDIKKSTTKGSLEFEYTDEETSTFKATYEFKPAEGDVTIEKPAGAIPIEQLMEKFNAASAQSYKTSDEVQRELESLSDEEFDAYTADDLTR